MVLLAFLPKIEQNQSTTETGADVADQRITKYREAALEMKQGHFLVDVPAEPVDDVGQLGMALRDLGMTLESRFRELHALTKVTEKINAGLILDEVLEHVYESFRPILPYDRIGFSLLEDDPVQGVLVRARWAKTDYKDRYLKVGFAAPLAGSSLEGIIETGEPRILNDLEAYLHAHPGSQATRLIVSEGVRSSLTCPLVVDGKPVGFMFFSSRYPDTYRNLHVDVFLEIAGQLATIVEKSRMHQELLDLNALKNRFLGMTAHDLRNPLGVVRGWADLMAAGDAGEITEKQREILKHMNGACERMLGMVNDLLDVSVIESGRLDLNLGHVDLEPYLKETHAAQEILASAKKIGLELDLDDELPSISMDRNRMDQVLANLIGNAIKFSPEGSTITIKGEHVGRLVEISVSDQGPGISGDEIDAIFSAFDQGSAKPTGGEASTGLGLMIAKRMVEAHGGRITVTSTPGAGSTFTVSLPLMAAPQPSAHSG